jgi:drug/metabolite transporter (DMT)-like permease
VHATIVIFSENNMVSPTLLVLGMITFGSLNTLVRQAQMETCSSSSFPADPSLAKKCQDPTMEPFNKPWIGNLFMFMGEVMLFLGILYEKRMQRQHVLPEPNDDGAHAPPNMPAYYLAIPASLDVLGSGLSGVSMLFISASVWQMLRGSMIIYTAILSVIFLKRRLSEQHVMGLILAFFGLSLVGLSAYLDSEATDYFSLFSRSILFSQYQSYGKDGDGSSLVIFGIVLTVLSQLCSAIQVVVEEGMLKEGGRYKTPSPARVVAYEGVWGLIIMLIVLFVMQRSPGDDHGSYENSIDSIEKMKNNGFLIFLIIIYCISIALFNQCGMAVSKYLSSLHRTLIDSLRALVVWAVQLLMFYCFNSKTYGVAWTGNSWLQLVGFSMLVLGTLVYNKVIDVSKIIRTRDPQDSLLRE